MIDPAEAALRRHVHNALAVTGTSQAEAARQLNLSTKHMSQMLTGHATLTILWADRILALCGMRLVIGLELVGPVDRLDGEDPR
ncbi:hypothetical protein [Streptomyces goshikiensis]|uniref:hypothetical protein n=1 Tax=Streptomyces goshikiensis TaxID=1942 RepID=UPI00368BE96F